MNTSLGKTEFCRIRDSKLYQLLCERLYFRIFDRKKVVAMYKKVVLDESILDLESWLPQSAVDEVVALILSLESQEETT